MSFVCNHVPGVYCPICNPYPPSGSPAPTTDTVVFPSSQDVTRLRIRIAELERLLAEEKAARGAAVSALRAVKGCLDETVWNAKAARNMAEQFLGRIEAAE